MNITPEIIQFCLFTLAIGSVVWRAGVAIETIKSKAKEDLTEFKMNILVRLEQIEGKAEHQEYVAKGYKEQLDHRSQRWNTTLEQMAKDLRDVQRYLDKTTSYTLRQARDNHD